MTEAFEIQIQTLDQSLWVEAVQTLNFKVFDKAVRVSNLEKLFRALSISHSIKAIWVLLSKCTRFEEQSN